MKFKSVQLLCEVCGKSKFTPGKSGNQFHPACSRKLQLLKAGANESKRKPVPLTEKRIDYFAKTGDV